MIVEDTLRARGLAPLGFFSWTPFGVAMLAAAIGFMLVFGRNMLSRETSAGEAGARQPSAYDLLGSYGLADKWHRLQVPHSSPLIGRSAAQMQVLEHFGAVLVGFEKHQHGRAQFLPATPATMFEPDDAIFAVGNEEQAQQLIAAHDLVVLPRLDQRQRHEALQEVGIAEIMLAPEAKLIGRTLRDVGFSSQYDLNVLAIRHRGEKLTTQLEDQTLDFGDTLLVAGGWGEIRRLRDDPEDFVVLTLPAEYSELMPARHRAPIAVAILVAMVAVMASQLVANAAATLIAALAMISTRCVRLDSIYRIVNWKTVVLVAGTLPLATALSKTGATALMAHGLVSLLGSVGPLAMLAAVFLVTALIGLFISNSATAVLVAPIAIDAARALHVSPYAFAITVSIGCSAAFVTPVSSAVNMLVMEPGGYTFGDYVKVGLPLLVLTLLVTVGLVAIIYQF